MAERMGKREKNSVSIIGFGMETLLYHTGALLYAHSVDDKSACDILISKNG